MPGNDQRYNIFRIPENIITIRLGPRYTTSKGIPENLI